MKKLVLTTVALVAGVFLIHAQGLVTINAGTKGTVETNGVTEGAASAAYGGYDVELLDMTSAAWASLSGTQQAGAANIFSNPSDLSLWTDSGISGATGTGLSSGEINGLGAGAGTTAANWGAPGGTTYASGATDYYVVVGWSTTLGTSWGSISNAIAGADLAGGANNYVGSSAVYFNEAGGGADSLPVISVWGTSAATTGLAGAGTPSGDAAGLLVLNPVPEPTTLALAGLGGLSMLFLRRRKA